MSGIFTKNGIKQNARGFVSLGFFCLVGFPQNNVVSSRLWGFFAFYPPSDIA